jgi:uncharacterized protein (TIGR02453 family)
LGDFYRMSFFSQDLFQFFIDLAPNNHKEWFDQHRKRYEQSVREPFREFVADLIVKMSLISPAFKGLEAKDCIFRINRDIRFSKDKSPYKMMVSALLIPGGKKSRSTDGIYLEIGPEHVRIYGGIYEMEKQTIEAVRHGIADDFPTFQSCYNDSDFVHLFGNILGEKNKMLPPEFKDAATTEPLLYNKQWYFYAEFDPNVALVKTFDERVLDCYRTARPLLLFFENCLKSNY